MSKFTDLGEDLANIVCEFAFACRYNAVFYSLKCYLQILCFRVPEQLLKRRIYSHTGGCSRIRCLCLNRSRISDPIGTCSTGVRYTCCFGSWISGGALSKRLDRGGAGTYASHLTGGTSWSL